MDKRKFNGGSRKNAGRKKSTRLSQSIKDHVDNMIKEMAKDDKIQKQINKDVLQLTLTSGFIYVIKDLQTNLIKVGVTQKDNPNSRLAMYASHNMDVDLLFIEYIDDCYNVEESLHFIFKDNFKKGDWMSINDKELFSIIRLINKHKYKKYYKD